MVSGVFLRYIKIMRSAPRILSAHMGMAASYWQNQFVQGVGDAAAIQSEMQDMMSGIQMYMQHPYQRAKSDLKCVQKNGEVSVFSCREYDGENDAPVLLLIPSLINKSDILDLLPERSFLRWLDGKETAVYLLDWGDVLEDGDAQNVDDVVQEKIIAAVSFLNEKHGRKIHVLGYCMGGTLGVAAVHSSPQYFASFIALAAPWDFHAGSRALLDRIKFWAPTILPSLKDKGHLSVDWLQMLFASLDPALAMHKFVRFAQMDEASDAARLFVAVEDWLNDGVALPQELAQQVMKDWYFSNAPLAGEWLVNGRAICAEDINVPMYIIASSKDRLVEFETAKALADQVAGATLYDPKCGHVGMIAGARAIENVWEPICEWITKNS